MAKFKPKWVVCTLKSDSYKYACKAIHKNEQGEYSNNYYFTGKPLKHLIRNKEDYNELVSLDIFVDYEPSREKEESAKSETTKERTLRKEAEAKAAIDNQENVEGGNKMSDEENAQTTETTEEESSTEESTDVAKEDESEDDSEDEEKESGESD